MIRYGMDLHLTPSTLASIQDIETSYARLGIVVNDIYSFEKELRAYAHNPTDTGKVLNMVAVQAQETGVDFATAKRVLWVLCREWEVLHLEMVREKGRGMNKEGDGVGDEDGEKEALRVYMKGLELVLGGNEKWSEYTRRYHEKE